MKYVFVDGSGNRYSFENGSVTYDPMTPERSSSGVYSGGAPFSRELDKKEVIGLVDVFERAIWSEKDHTDKRTMGSGTLFKRVGEEQVRYYFRMNSNSMKEIITYLSKFKEKN